MCKQTFQSRFGVENAHGGCTAVCDASSELQARFPRFAAVFKRVFDIATHLLCSQPPIGYDGTVSVAEPGYK